MKKRFIILIALTTLLISSFIYIQHHQLTINDIGLKVLSWVKSVQGNGVNISDLGQTDLPIMKHDKWTILLQKHVNKKGQVNYLGFIKDSTEFQFYLTELTNHPPGKNWTTDEQLAYWINVYNAFTVKLIIDHYPLKSIKDIADGLPMINSPWDIKFFNIGNIDFDLNTVEHEILRKQFDESRIHFAINCASFSCPKLRTEAYQPDHINEQLEEQTNDFINNSTKNIITPTQTQLSQIFDWFKRDFTQETDLISFVKKYNPTINTKNKIEYLEYDWSLNE